MKTWTADKHVEADPQVAFDVADEARPALLHAGVLGVAVDRIAASAVS